jgi:hypothetical protein
MPINRISPAQHSNVGTSVSDILSSADKINMNGALKGRGKEVTVYISVVSTQPGEYN